MSAGRFEFWVRKRYLERLCGASHICYLLGGRSGPDGCREIARLAADLERLGSLRNRVLVVPLGDWQHRSDYAESCQEPDAGPSVYFRSTDDVDGESVDGGDVFTELAYPPAAYSQLVYYGGEFCVDSRGRRNLDLVEGLEEWLGIDRIGSSSNARLILVGQRVSPEFLSGSQSPRLIGLLERSSAVGLVDGESLRAITGRYSSGISSNVFVLDSDGGDHERQTRPRVQPPMDGIAVVATAVCAPEETTSLQTDTASASLLIGHWLTASHMARLEENYQAAADELLESMKRLSDLQFEYDRLLNASAKLTGEAQRLRREDESYGTALRFQIAERLNDLLSRNQAIRHLGEIVAHWIWRLIR